MDDVTVARTIHVLSVVHWFGGVAFVTAVILPAVSRRTRAAGRLALFEAVEHCFAAQVRVSVPLAGLSGLYMVERLDLWPRFLDPAAWWLIAMLLLWLVFMAILFVLEPLVLRGSFARRARTDPDGAFALVRRAHWLLLAAGAATAGAGVLGAHGGLP